MKKILKNKKVIIGLVIILSLVIVIGCVLVFGGTKDKTEGGKVLKEDTFTAYVKINPLVKLTFKASYYECEDKDGNVSMCGKYTNEVTDAELLNDDANSTFSNFDFEGKTLNDAIASMVLYAEEQGYDVSNVNITTDWNYEIDEIKQSIEEKLKTETKVEVAISFNYQKIIDVDKILENENIKSYTVSFDSDGGTNVSKQTIIENKKVEKPKNPTKDGYTFVEWQLDGKTYDFDSKVTKDIILKSKWTKKTDTNNNSNTTNNNNSNTTNNNNNNTSNETNNNQSQMSQKEKDNETLKQQLKAKGLVWDFNTEEEANRVLNKWAAAGGYGGKVLKNSYGESDTAYTVQITLNTAACGGNEILNIDWRNSEPVDFIYYLHSKGYNCSGNIGYYNGKSFHINDKNEIVWD